MTQQPNTKRTLQLTLELHNILLRNFSGMVDNLNITFYDLIDHIEDLVPRDADEASVLHTLTSHYKDVRNNLRLVKASADSALYVGAIKLTTLEGTDAK